MATGVRTRTYSSVSLGTILWLVVGLIITINQGYWHVDKWTHHFTASLITAIVATVLWPISLFFTWALHRR
ncbi:MAG: hypothetical protein ACQSGP_11695 [Frankia sp.]